MLAEMGVAIGVDGHTVGLFQPKRVMRIITVKLTHNYIRLIKLPLGCNYYDCCNSTW